MQASLAFGQGDNAQEPVGRMHRGSSRGIWFFPMTLYAFQSSFPSAISPPYVLQPKTTCRRVLLGRQATILLAYERVEVAQSAVVSSERN